MRSHTLAPTIICDLPHSLCWSPLTDLGHISSVTYVCHPLWFVCGHRKGILTSPLKLNSYFYQCTCLWFSVLLSCMLWAYLFHLLAWVCSFSAHMGVLTQFLCSQNSGVYERSRRVVSPASPTSSRFQLL